MQGHTKNHAKGEEGGGSGDLSTKRALVRDLQIQVLLPKLIFLNFHVFLCDLEKENKKVKKL